MSILLNLHQPPFNFLEPEQRDWLTRCLDFVSFPAGCNIIQPGQNPQGLYIITHGVVEERDASGEQLFSQYAQEDMFDIRSALELNACKSHYYALEATECYFLKASDFHYLLEVSKDFASYFRTDLGSRQVLLDERENNGMSEFLLSRINEDCIRQPLYVTGQTSLAKVAALMQEHERQSVLVRTFKNIGIVTCNDILKATLLGDKTKNTGVSDIAQFNLINIEYGDFVFKSLLMMTRHNIDRVIVSRDGDIVGTLELMDVLGMFATHSNMVAMRIEQANTIAELQENVNRIDALLSSLNHQGVNVVAIMELMTTLHRRLMQRSFELIFPKDLQGSLCILAIGTEGRGEHVLKPGQKNAIIVADESQRDRIVDYLNNWHAVLCDLGYPRKIDDYTQAGSRWINTLDGWELRLARWLQSPDKDSVMDMSIFIDSQPICGDIELFTQLRKQWVHREPKTAVLASIMATPALRYEMPLTFLGNLRENNGSIDIRKGGILPLVQGIRALAFEHEVSATNTLARLDQLQALKVINPEYAQSIKDTLLLLFRIRLRYQLESSSDRDEGKIIKLSRLRSAERDMLRYALHRVKKFKQYLADHFQLAI